MNRKKMLLLLAMLLIGLIIFSFAVAKPPVSDDAEGKMIFIEKYCLPDLVLLNGKVVTVDEDFTIAEAVAVKNDKIVAVGKNKDIRKLIGRNTKVIDLKGATVLPGIIDSHIHVQSFAVDKPPFMLDVGFPTVKSIADIVAMVDSRVKEVSPGDWIRGRGWDEGYLQECLADPNRHPTRWDLDPVSPNNPVALTDFSYHNLWVNSKALELAGITKDTPDPPGGIIVRDPVSGEPTGILMESAAELVRVLIPPFSYEERKEALKAVCKELNSLGITSVEDPMVTGEMIRLYQDVYLEGDLTVRTNLRISVETLEDIHMVARWVGATNLGNEFLKVVGLKMFADGIPPSETAWMWEPYLDGRNGALVVPGETDEERYNYLINMIVTAHNYGFQVGIHATGDRAISACLDGFERAYEENPWDARHFCIHADFMTPEDCIRNAEYNKVINVQAAIKWTIAEFMAGIVGEDRAAYQWPLRTMIDAGNIITGSSDASVTYPDWRIAVAQSILRESKATGKVWGPEQRITVKEAIKSYTINGAYQSHEEKIKGSIEPGKLADFCIIGGDILTIDPHKIPNIPILMTILGGEIVYNSGYLTATKVTSYTTIYNVSGVPLIA
ncbi:MAG: amidohydrolase, partial [Candidatus Bathyarchaeia archaeon]